MAASDRHRVPPPTAAFLLAQLGAHSARVFADLLGSLDLTPPLAGVLRLIASSPGQSQQAIAGILNTPPSRLVTMLDQLERRGLIERRRNPDDRRHHALYLTDEGGAFLRRVGEVSARHEDTLCAGLDPAERAQLRDLLARLADRQGLTPGVHPGYQHLSRRAAD